MGDILSSTASKSDLKGGIDRLEMLIRDLQQEKTKNATWRMTWTS